MKIENAIKILKLGSLYHFIGGGIFLIFSSSLVHFFNVSESSHLFLQVVGVFYLVFSIGYYFSSNYIEENWLFVLMALVEKVLFGLYGIFLVTRFGLNPAAISFFIVDAIVWICLLYRILDFIYAYNNYEEDSKTSFADLAKMVRTNKGDRLIELSNKRPLLLVFIRHLGCTFCRETVSEISEIENKIKEKNLEPVFVHLSDPSFGDKFFGEYFNHEVSHISDPTRVLYRALKIKRGSLWQLYGLKTWYRGIVAAIFKGHGGVKSIEGDVMQLGAYFILDKGQIVFSHYNGNASEQFDLDLINKTY